MFASTAGSARRLAPTCASSGTAGDTQPLHQPLAGTVALAARWIELLVPQASSPATKASSRSTPDAHAPRPLLELMWPSPAK